MITGQDAELEDQDRSPRRDRVSNILTVDVEEYFHPTEVQTMAPPGQWNALPSRIDVQVKGVLEILESRQAHATFFILGWVAQRRPDLVRAIVDAGHQIGCHSYSHQLVYNLTPRQFREDTQLAVKVTEDACGVTPRAYRAPSYSITRESLWALDILVECGFTHDSSIYPIAHDRYGISGFERHTHDLHTASGPITEIPIATVRLPNGQIAPIGGGGYLRLLPYRYTSAGIRRLNRIEGMPACIYFHPWEIDPQLPRLAPGLIARARTYTGLKGMRRKLERLLADFSFSTMVPAHTGRVATAGSAFPS